MKSSGRDQRAGLVAHADQQLVVRAVLAGRLQRLDRLRNSSKRFSSSALLMRAAHCISLRRRIRSMSFSAGSCSTRLRPASFAAAHALSAADKSDATSSCLRRDRHHADARAEAEHALVPDEAEVRCISLAQVLGRAQRLVHRAALEQHAELVAAEPRERVAPADLGLQQRPDLLRAARRRRCGRRCR